MVYRIWELIMIVGHSSVNRSTKWQWRKSEHCLSWLTSPLTSISSLCDKCSSTSSLCDDCSFILWSSGGWDTTRAEKKQRVAVWVEIEHYSIVYFECITEFDTLLRWASAEGRAHMRYVNSWLSDVPIKRIWTPPLAEAHHYSASNSVMCSNYVTE